MRKGLIGRKLGMTQVFTEDGESMPATVIKVEPSVVIQKKTVQREGYDAVQIGCGRVKQKHVTKPLQGHFQKADKGFFRILRELRGDVSGFELGQEVRVDVFKPGDYVDITGTSKGKGFAGVIKRHGFRGGRATHGSMFHRAPGSIGASAEPSRVFKGRKLPGQMGCEKNTVQNMRVLVVRPEDSAILVKGSIPGGKQGVVLIRQAIKK